MGAPLEDRGRGGLPPYDGIQATAQVPSSAAQGGARPPERKFLSYTSPTEPFGFILIVLAFYPAVESDVMGVFVHRGSFRARGSRTGSLPTGTRSLNLQIPERYVMASDASGSSSFCFVDEEIFDLILRPWLPLLLQGEL